MNLKFKLSDKKALTAIFVLAFLSYFISEAVLRQYVLYRAGSQSISLSSILEKVPTEIRDNVTRRIRIAELQDKLDAAVKPEDIITISIALASEKGKNELEKQYAEIIDKYPKNPHAAPAFLYFFKAPSDKLKSVSIEQYHDFMKNLREPELFFAWSSGLSSLKSKNATNKELLKYLYPLLNEPPKHHEYKSIYVDLSEIAFQENDSEAELKARKYDDLCDSLPFYDKKMEKAYRNKLAKEKKAKTKQAKPQVKSKK